MKTNITKGLEPDLAKEVESSFKSSSVYRKYLTKLLEDKIEASRKASCSKEKYYSANWAYSMADSMGYERALREMISLIN